MKQRQTHRHSEQTCGCQVFCGGRGMDWEPRIHRCKVVCKEWITKVLLNSTGSYIQYSVINCNRKEYKGIYVYI